MIKARIVMCLGLILGLSACASTQMPSRGASMTAPLLPEASTVSAPRYNVVSVDAEVPRDLLVSEANVYLPRADIVWHGDPEGDRYKQIEAIFETAMNRATADMTSGRAVRVVAQLQKFHAVTPITRDTVGGNFAMHFYLTVLDARTGEVIDGPRLVVADTPASGGIRALREEQQGITQKVVVTRRLVEAFEAELTRAPLPPQRNLTVAVNRNAFSPSDLMLAE